MEFSRRGKLYISFLVSLLFLFTNFHQVYHKANGKRQRRYYPVFLAFFFFYNDSSARSGPRPLIQFRIHFSYKVVLLVRVISPSQGRYLNTGQHKHRINKHTHASVWIPTHNPSIRASEDSSCLRPRGYCDRQCIRIIYTNSVRTSQETDPNQRSRLPSERRQFMSLTARLL
jgi:hypothetical protein